MPAYGGGIGRRTPEPRAAPAPVARPTPTRQANAFGPPISAQPFAGAQHQAQQHVEQAQRALPKQSTPQIPRIPNPTPQQTHTALTLVRNSQRAAVGPNASVQRIKQYQQELANDPRQRAFRETIAHYVSAAEGHLSALEGRREVSGNQSLSQPLSAAARALSPADAASISREGNYSLPNLLQQAGQQARQANASSRAQAIPGVQRAQAEKGDFVPLGAIDLSKLAAGAANLKLAPGGVVGDVINEAIDLPAQALLSGAIAGSALRRGVQSGDWSSAKGLGSTVLHQLEHPVQTAEQAPLNTALMFGGIENAAGRVAGKLGRAAGVDAFSTARPDLKLYGDTPAPARAESVPRPTPRSPVRAPAVPTAATQGERIVGRQYNTDPIRKAAQIAYERHVLPNLPGQLAQKDPFQATGWRLRRNLVGGITKVGRVDRIAAAGEDTRRNMVKPAVAKMEAVRPSVGDHVAVPLIVQRAVRSPQTALLDLQKVRKLWASAQASGDLKGSALGANKANLTNLDALLAHPDMQTPASAAKALGPAFAAAERHTELGHPFTAEAVHGGKLKPEQLRAGLFPYAQTHMGAVYRDGGMRGPTGGHLSNEAILAHMAESGVKPPGFISHKTGIAGRGSFFKSSLRQPTLERFNRTGGAFLNGTADHSWEGAVGSLAKQATEAAQLQVRRRTLNRLTFGGPYDTQALAAKAADNFHASPEGSAIANSIGKVVPVHLGSGQIVEQGHIAPAASAQDVLKQFGLHEHTPIDAQQLGKYALIPDKVAKRLQAHDNALSTDSEVARALQVYQQAFRRAKLNTSMPHIAGVIQEQGIRLGAEGVGPTARAAGSKINRNLHELAELDPHGQLADTHGPLGDRYREIASTIANRGGLAGSQKANDVVRKADQFQQTSALGYIAHGTEGAVKSRAGAAIGAPWRAVKMVVEGGLAKVEHGTRDALLAKAVKDSGIISSYHSVLKMQDQAVKALIAGNFTPNMADHLAEAIDNMGGNWNRQTPAVRKAVGKFTPFGLWWLNSMRWLYRLPVTHPVKTAMAAGLYQATREQRNAKGQGYDAAHPVPNFLQGTIDVTLPLLGKGKIAPSYYSPGGTGGPEATNTAAEQFLPGGQSIYAAARKQNPLTGAKLETAGKKELKAPEALLNVLGELVSGPTPFATQAEKALTQGGKPYGTSNLFTDIAAKLGGPPQIKPGTERSWPQVLGKLISPTRFDFPGKGEVGAQGSGRTPSAPTTPAEAARIGRAVQRHEAGGGSAAQAARIKRAEEAFDRARRY